LRPDSRGGYHRAFAHGARIDRDMSEKPPYASWARYYDALYAFKDYRADADRLKALADRFNPGARTLLDVACGSGRHLEFLREHFAVEGADPSEDFLQALVARSPGVPVHRTRMEDLALGRRFDVIICMFSSIGFVRTLEGLHKTMKNFAAHLDPGGVAIVEPWFSRETFWPGKVNAHFVDQPELKVAWFYTTALRDGLSVLSNRFLVATPEGFDSLEDEQVLGLFDPADYREAMAQAGLEVVLSEGFGPEWKRGIHVGRRPA
jgi:SAM-dependent methyltransferase